MAQTLFHYPWRFFLPTKDYRHLPEPNAGEVSPALGAFLRVEGTNEVEELPAPSIASGRDQYDCRARGGRVFRYDQECVHQYHVEAVDSKVRRGHFALADAGISLSRILYVERDQRAQYYYELSLAYACEQFRQYIQGAQEFASASLIWEIASKTVSAIENIVYAPRKVLTRVHREVSIARVQEFDTKALLDYARRPGRNAPMKAGGKQRLLGVVREETSDTPENRVVLDFICRAETAALQYVNEMRERCPNRAQCTKRECDGCRSGRLQEVQKFIRKCEAWKMSENLRGVRRLEEPFTRANYVLQQNARYVQVWRYYLKLLAQENVEEDIWRWQRRAFADMMRMVMMCVWELRLNKDNRVVMRASERPFMVRERNDRGAWLADDPYEDALVFRRANGGDVTLYLLNAKEAKDVLHWEGVLSLNADFFWIVLEEGRVPKVCPVWCMCEDRKWQVENAAGVCERMAVEEVRALCRSVGQGVEFDVEQGWILAPRSEARDRELVRQENFVFLPLDIFREFEAVLNVVELEVERMMKQ